MATILESLQKSSINIKSISQTLSDTKKSTSAVNESVGNISRIVATNTRVKRELFERSNILSSRREEASKRQELEDQIESTKVSTSPQAGLAFASRSEKKGPLARLLGFLGFTFAGWILENLPTWIFMGQEFISRINSFGRSMYNMVYNMQNIIKYFGDTLGYSLNSILRLDFDEFAGEGTVARSFEELNLAVQDLGTNITDTFKLFTTPLTESLETGEQAPGLGEQREDTMFPGIQQETAGSPTSSPSGGGGGKYKPLLNLISSGESPGGGYSAMYPSENYPQILNMSIEEVVQFQKQKLKDGRISAAIGRYQMLYPEKYAAAAGIPLTAKFSPENQDKMVIAYLKKNRKLGEWEQGKISDEAFSEELAREFGAFKSASGYVLPGNTGSIGFNKLKPVLKQIKSTPQQQSTPQKPTVVPQTQMTTTLGEYFRPLPQGSYKGGSGQGFGASRDGGTRKHLGLDITESNWKPGSDPRIPVVAIRGGIVSSRNYVPGEQYLSGVVVDQDDGYSVRYLHMSPSIKPGQKVFAGQRIGRLVNLGNQTHLHIELYSGSKLLDPTKYITSIEKGQTPKVTSPPAAQISAQPKPSQPAAMTPERKGSQVMLIDATQPQVPQASYPSQQQPSVTSIVSEFKLLNNFIKNKLLLDLAYL